MGMLKYTSICHTSTRLYRYNAKVDFSDRTGVVGAGDSTGIHDRIPRCRISSFVFHFM